MSVQAIPQSNEENEDLCHQLLTARTVSSVTVGSVEKEDGDTKAEEQQKLPKEVSPTSEQFFTLQSKRFSPSNHPHQQNAVKLEELLSELQQLDLAVRGLIWPGHINGYEEYMKLPVIKKFLVKDSEGFCETIFNIYTYKTFNREHMIKELSKSASYKVKRKLEIKYEGKWLTLAQFNYINRLHEKERDQLNSKYGAKWMDSFIKEYEKEQK
uniref:Uncharacterized protein n=1 Tax=Meloidogyne enterolobii TaxID=390850 RepID=A0A6V7TX88_MELEN|nr:unnamed protein product [Meloidogyne enterolobii]